jgi:Intracellular proteinase inhibitor
VDYQPISDPAQLQLLEHLLRVVLQGILLVMAAASVCLLGLCVSELWLPRCHPSPGARLEPQGGLAMRKISAWAGALVIIGVALPAPTAWAQPARYVAADEPVIVTLAAGQSIYAVGQPVPMKLTLCNASAERVTLRFRSSYRCDFRARQVPGGRVVWQWSQGKVFLPAFNEQTLEPGETWEATVWWKAEVPVGIYALDAVVTCDAPGPLISAPVLVRIVGVSAGGNTQSDLSTRYASPSALPRFASSVSARPNWACLGAGRRLLRHGNGGQAGLRWST